jgi:hypothetical protein
MTRKSRVTIVTSWGVSPSNSAVARCRASKVRSGSTGKGRPARASTASVMATTSQRRLKACSQRSALRSSAGVKRCATRARTSARVASANVRADVIRRRLSRRELRAAASCSSRAASRALVSTYLNVVDSVFDAVERRPERRADCVPLRLATIAINQLSNRTTRNANVRPLQRNLSVLCCRHDNASGYEFLVPASPPCSRTRRNELRDHTPVSGNRHAFTGLNLPYVVA